MSEDWDADGAAARAMGEAADVGEGVAEIVDGDGGDAGGGDPDPTPSAGGGGGDDVGGSGGWLPTSATDAARSLFVAPERGPTADTFAEYGVGHSQALALDGVTDWLLDLVGTDVGDSLGPAGKIGLGLTEFVDRPDRGGGDDDDQEASDDAGDGEAPDIDGVSGA